METNRKYFLVIHNAGYPRQSENRENGKKHSLSGKTQGIWKFCQNTGNFVSSSCKYSYSRVKDIAIFAAEKIVFFPEAG